MDLSTFLQLFAWPLVALMLASIASPLVGAFLQVRGTSFHGVALPQIAAFGVALGFALHPALVGHGHGPGSSPADFHDHGLAPSRSYLFAWATAAVTVALFAFSVLSRRGRFGEQPAATGHVAAAFALASGGTVIAAQLAPQGGLHIDTLLMGETLASGPGDAWLLGAVTVLVSALVLLGWRPLTLAGHDPDFARARGLGVGRWNLALDLATGATVIAGSLSVGALPMFALLVLPPLAARVRAPSMAAFLLRSPLLGLTSAAAGAAIAYIADLPVGASVVAGCAVVCALWITLVAARSHLGVRRP